MDRVETARQQLTDLSTRQWGEAGHIAHPLRKHSKPLRVSPLEFHERPCSASSNSALHDCKTAQKIGL